MNGTQRVRSALRTDHDTVVVPYYVAGWPSFSKAREQLWEAADAGAAAVELGLPFSDPVADGPILQAAIQQALDKGVTIRKCHQFVHDLVGESFPVPVLGMTYANVLHAPGYASAARTWARAGFAAAIVPDVPWEESGPLRSAFHGQGVGLVSFASPGTSRVRLRRICGSGDAFVYLVAVYGTTGSRARVGGETRDLVKRARQARPPKGAPLAVGFGVSKPGHVEALAQAGADAVVVGSAIAARLQRGQPTRSYLRSLVRAGRDAR